MPPSYGVPADHCTGCGCILWLDRFGRCSDCALYDENGWTLQEALAMLMNREARDEVQEELARGSA